MSYTVNTPCGDCIKKKEGCSDGIVVTGAVQGIIHPMIFGKGHQGAGSVTLECVNKVVEEVVNE
jgi:hypothetical protein